MFSTLLPEVISKYVFTFLHVNDLLRLRRVCKVSKELAEDYLRLHGTSERVVFINLGASSNDLTNFLALTYPIALTRFDISIHVDTLSWDREEMQTFLTLYGEKITHLSIPFLYIPIKSPAAVQFFEGLPNLKELRIEALPGDGYDSRVERDLNLPSTFKRLKHLHVEQYTIRPQELWKFIEECSTNLERVNYPRPNSFSLFRAPNVFEWVRRIVVTRHRENPNEPNLKYLDLAGFWDGIYGGDDDEDGSVRSFYSLVTTCSAHGVKLQNVDARWIEAMMKLDTPDRGLHGDKISRCVVSIRNLTTSMFHLELPFLEAIKIWNTYDCYLPQGEFQRQPWSNLKELKLRVNSDHLESDEERVSVSRLFEFFFHGIRRESLESLRLEFCWLGLPHPNMTSVCASCPNLKKLYIQGWPGSNRDIAQLWGNLPLLEHVTFEWCEDLGDAAFLGDDVTRPVILKAKRLKSLAFQRLHEMPGITDNLFKSALRHMPLKTLYLEAYEPVSSITLAGLESLLTGKFAETIEKFPLKGEIKLEGVTDEQLVELEGKFRSANM